MIQHLFMSSKPTHSIAWTPPLPPVTVEKIPDGGAPVKSAGSVHMNAIGPTRLSHFFLSETRPAPMTVWAPASIRSVRPARSGVGDSGIDVIAAPWGLAV